MPPSIVVPVDSFDRTPPYNPRTKNHYWITIAAYHVDPTKWKPGDRQPLDRENLVSIGATGCLHCEQQYSDKLAKKPCPGDPSRG